MTPNQEHVAALIRKLEADRAWLDAAARSDWICCPNCGIAGYTERQSAARGRLEVAKRLASKEPALPDQVAAVKRLSWEFGDW